ncbi:MAG: serine/threonine-protein kinase PknK, partial [Bacteroidota bacterium]|nr:serine/threonine-protein kinase PknK [Bacteroidota bacterium]
MPTSLIYESARSKVFLAENGHGEKVIHKILNSDFPSPKDVAQFYNEQNITQDIGIEGVRKVVASLKENNKHALHLEWFDGKTFAEVFRNKKDDILDFLTIAIEIVKVLGEVHQKGVIHQYISPYNVLVYLQQRKISLIDFGISTRFQTKHIDLSHPRNLQGTLAFSSPEQTGRMNRSIDYRTDLYSLGATFFYILTGRPPFESEDTMELVHAHIAKSPPRIVDLNPIIPVQVSRIIDKLLEKNAENRYQSTYGLQHDLALCLKSLRESHEMKEFPLGQQDFSGHFQIHQKLYGRDKEIQIILDRFESCAQGSRQLLLLSGYSGTGKTALVHEVHRPITLKQGYYSEWKFDQFNKSTPYSAFLKIFENLIDLFLLENEETLNRLAQDIRMAVGDEGKVLTDLFPNLEGLIGKQPDIPSLGGEESQRRFNYLMQKFFRALCTSDHPIVFFIDDLQWADASSLQLLENLLGLQNGGYFLCLGAYRDNETPPGHPLMSALTHMEQSGILVETIKLGNLHKGDINQMLADSMDRDAGDPAVWDLTDLVVRKTAGNAFFTSQFLMSIADTELLRYDTNLREWTWSLDQIKAENITDNVVELMAEKILRLPKDTQEVLKYAACLGNTVDVVILSVVNDSDPREDQRKLEPAIREGLIFKINDRQLKFGHDRIQQAIYSLLDEDSKTRLHYQIGRLLLDRSNPEQEEIHLFDIVNHFNSAESIFRAESPSSTLELSRFNLRAALRSKLNSAFDVAMDYLHQAEALLPENPWKKEYTLSYSIYKELNEISYLCAQYTLTDKYFDEIVQHAHSDLDKIKAYQVKIKAFQAQNELTPAVETGLEALELLGVRMPRKPTKLDVMLSLVKNEWQLRNKDMAKIIAMPPMTDPKAIEAMHIFSSVASSSYWSEPNLIPIVAYKMIWMSMKHGRHILSAFAFTGYGIIMCGILGAMRKGYRYGEIGLKILELENSKEWTAQIEDPMYGLILHWNKHVGESLKPLRDSFYVGLETGENEFACVNASLYCIHSFLSGRPLEGLEKEAEVFSQTFAQLKQETQFKYNEIYRQAMLCLMGEADDPKRLVGRAYDAEEQLSLHQQNKDLSGTFFIYFNQMLLAYLF